MTATMPQMIFDEPVAASQPTLSDAARLIGKLGGRPKGSFSSPLGNWLRSEIRQRSREGYRCREAFCILRDTEDPDGNDAFILTDYTGDQHDIEPNARVSWAYYRKLWRIFQDTKTGFGSLGAYHRQ